MPAKNSSSKTRQATRPAAKKLPQHKKAAAVPAKKLSALAAAARVLGEAKQPKIGRAHV